MSVQAKKSLGQNFLVDKNYQQKIVSSLRASGASFVLEIGPGQGAITQHLVPLFSQVMLIEKDDELYKKCCQQYALHENVKVQHADFMDVVLKELLMDTQSPRIAVGNLPYNVSSQILIQLLEHHTYFSEMFLMFQREVAQRMIAKHGTREYGLLSLWAQIYSEPKILFHIPPTSFRPQPKVFSSFVSLKLREQPCVKEEEKKFFWWLMHHLFQHRRKTIQSTLKLIGIQSGKLQEGILEPNQRAETMSVEELLSLSRVLQKYCPSVS